MEVNDVIEDANNTFIKDMNYEFKNELALEETQMDLVIKHDKAFNWQDDDEIKLRILTTKKKKKGNFIAKIRSNITNIKV